MAEHHPNFEEAVLYVLDRLEPAERREFESRLQKTPELQALVRELEAGATALALATPQREPPAEVWQRISAVVGADKKKPASPWWYGWARVGWAAALVCLLGWVVTVAWLLRADLPSVVTSVVTPLFGLNPRTQSSGASEATTPPTLASPSQQTTIVTNFSGTGTQLSLQDKGQIAALRSQVLDLESKVAQLSHTVTQQQAQLMEPTRIKFFNVSPAGVDSVTGTNGAMPSPIAQRALQLALARQLGWLPPSTGNDPQELELGPSSVTNNPPAARSASRENRRARTEQQSTGPEPEPATPPSTIPGYASLGTNGTYDVTLAMDSSMLPAGTAALNVWVAADAQAAIPQLYGLWNIGSAGSVLTLRNANSVFLTVPNQDSGEALRWIFTNPP